MSVIQKHRRTVDGFGSYLLSRGSTFAFIGFFMGGLAVGSLFCIAETDGAQLLRSIVNSDLTMQMSRNYPQLLMSAISGFAAIFLFAYLCINCTKGAMLIYIVPLVYGLSLGAIITAILCGYGYHALRYILVCIFLPKVIETFLLLSLCNKTARYCKEGGGGKAPHKGRPVFPIMLYLVVFAVYFVVESLVVLLFRGLF